jgi:hypothetical protein
MDQKAKITDQNQKEKASLKNDFTTSLFSLF